MDDGECLEIDSRLVHLMQYDSTVKIKPFELLNLTGLGFRVFATNLYDSYKVDVGFLSDVVGKVVSVYPRKVILDSCQTKGEKRYL